MKSSRIGIAAMLAAASFAGLAATPHVPDVIVQSDAPRAVAPKRITPATRAAWTKKRGRCGPGWTPRQVQRMATKRRNQQRNKRAHRGGR